MNDIRRRVTLRPISAETVRAVVRLEVTEYQNRFVAPNAVSLAQALFAPEAWYRAIYRDEQPVGFVMLSDESLRVPMPQSPKVAVWRFMVDARYQRQGIGRAAMELVLAHVRSKGLFDRLALSYVPGEGSPEALYRSFGFVPTGEVDDGEVVMELPLGDVRAQTPADPGPPHMEGFDHLHVFVTDRAASETWYRDVLGFERVQALAAWAAEGGPLTLADRGGTVHLALFERPSQPCRSTIALRASAVEYRRWKAHLAAKLAGKVTEQDHGLSISLYFADPDGNPYEITTYEAKELRRNPS